MRLTTKSRHFLSDDRGQDLIEYTLLISFVVLASAATLAASGASLSGMWSSASSQFSAANSALPFRPSP